jgi:DNA-binding LytR/AlgR family response regulator
MQNSIANLFGMPLTLSNKTKYYTNEILYFEGDVNYTWIHFKSGQSKIVAHTLLFIQQKTESQNFTRISRKHLVNRKFIVEVGSDYVMLANKTVLPIARRRRRSFLLGE